MMHILVKIKSLTSLFEFSDSFLQTKATVNDRYDSESDSQKP